MEIQKINQNINWQQLTAKEILKYKDDGLDVPDQYQRWAMAISAALEVDDEITYEVANGETDIDELEKTMGKALDIGKVTEPAETENNIGNENPEQNGNRAIATPEEPLTQKDEDPTLADIKITTDPEEILKRKMKKGIPS